MVSQVAMMSTVFQVNLCNATQRQTAVIMIILIDDRTETRISRIIYDLNTYAQVARAQSCANHERLSRTSAVCHVVRRDSSAINGRHDSD